MTNMHAPRTFCSVRCWCRLLLRDWVASMAHKYPVWQVGAAQAAVHLPLASRPTWPQQGLPCQHCRVLIMRELWLLDEWGMRLMAARQGAQIRVLVVQAIEGAIREEGWRMVMLLRLSPILPFTPLNYALSVTPISSWAYTWASALGIIPGMPQYAGPPAGSGLPG